MRPIAANAVFCLCLSWLVVPSHRAQAGSRPAGRSAMLASSRVERTALAHEVTLAAGGQARAVVVVPDQATAPVRFAADELVGYLGRITGARFTVASRIPADGRAIVLGDRPEARQAGIDVSAIARDGYAIRTVGPTIFIAGMDDNTAKADILFTLKGKQAHERLAGKALYKALSVSSWDFERGTLYGVYRFLEELGVRWFFPGPKGEAIPHSPELGVRAFHLLEEPHYVLRHVGTDRWVLSRVRRDRFPHVDPNEYKTLGWSGRINRLWLLRLRGSSAWFAFNHRPPRLRWEERFGKTHPEYFALLPNGRRDLRPSGRRTGHLCYTHPGVFKETMLDIEAFFTGKTAGDRGIPKRYQPSDNRGWGIAACYGDSVSMLPHDSFRPCQCPQCKPLQRPDAPRWKRDSGLVWPFVVKVAGKAEQRFPDKLVFCLAYSSYTGVPEGLTRLPDNVVVGLCPHGSPRKLNKTYNLTTPAARAQVADLARRWRAMNTLPMLGWFHHLYGYSCQRCGVPMLIPHALGALMRDMQPYMRLMHIEFDPDFLMLEHVNRYVLQRLCYNPAEDVDAILDDYCSRFYGPAGKLVRGILADVERRSMSLAESAAGRLDTWEKHFTEAAVKRYRQVADQTVALTRDTPQAEAAELFSRYFVGMIERGFRLYVREFRDVANSKAAVLPVRRVTAPIAVDGKLDEAAWGEPATDRFGNNANGEPTPDVTELRLLYDAQNVYVAFTCHDPNAAKLSEIEGDADYIEIFLDPDRDHRDYYWLLIDLAGRVTDVRYPGGSKTLDKAWASGARVAVTRQADRWVMEIALPRGAMEGAAGGLAGRRWGANFCRTRHHPRRAIDRFSSSSPLMRGRFHQPDLFGTVQFGK